MSLDVRQPEISACIAISQAFMIKSHQIQNRSVQVMNVDLILSGVVTVIIC